MLTDAQGTLLEPLVEVCRPYARVPPCYLRRTTGTIFWRYDKGAKWLALPTGHEPWWMATQTFICWAYLGVWERMLALVQDHGLQLSMTFLEGTSIRAHQKAACAARNAMLRHNGTIMKRLATLVGLGNLGRRPRRRTRPRHSVCAGAGTGPRPAVARPAAAGARMGRGRPWLHQPRLSQLHPRPRRPARDPDAAPGGVGDLPGLKHHIPQPS